MRSVVAGALAGALTVAFAGAALLVATTPAAASGSPFSISPETTATLESWGLHVYLQAEGVYIEAAPESYAIAMVDSTAYAPTVFPPLAAGSSMTLPAAGVEPGVPWVTAIGPGSPLQVSVRAHSSYWPGSPVEAGRSVAQWVTDDSTSAVLGAALASAGLLGHNPDTYSDCTVVVCGFWVSRAAQGVIGGVPSVLATATSIFVAVADDRSGWTAPWPDGTVWAGSASGLHGTSSVTSADGATTVTDVTIVSNPALGTMYPTVDAPASPGDAAHGVLANSVPVLLHAVATGYTQFAGNPIRTTVVRSTVAGTAAPTATPGVVPSSTPALVADPVTVPAVTTAAAPTDGSVVPQRVVFQTGEDASSARSALNAVVARAAPDRAGIAGGLGVLSLGCAVVTVRCVRPGRRQS